MEHLTLSAAADQLKTSKKTLWRAVKAGKLKASRVQQGSSWEYQVTPADLEEYRSTVPPSRDSGTPVAGHQDMERDMSQDTGKVSRDTGTPPGPPVELYLALVDRLTRAERRAVELELALQQSQRLLAENAESIAEREARAREAEAKADKLVATLEATKPARKQTWVTGALGWLGIRRSRTKDTSAAESA